MQPQWPERLRDYFQQQADTFGNLLVDSFHFLALFVIGAITAWAAVITVGGLLTGDEGEAQDAVTACAKAPAQENS